MPTEIPCLSDRRRTARPIAMMDGLEPRTLMSSSSSIYSSIDSLEKSITLPVSTNVVHIGSKQSVKTLSAAKWPGRGSSVTFVLDPGSYSVSPRFVYGNVSIIAANPGSPPTLKLPAVFKKKGGKYIGGNATLYTLGSLNIRNVKTTGGEDAVFLGTSSSGKIDAENVNMTDGGAIYRGSGGSTVLLKNIAIHGIPRTNAIANFDHNIGTVVVDNRGTSTPIQQGGHIVNGNPVGESPIRVMDVNNLVLIGVTTKPWFYKSGREWKQDIQLRPSSNLIRVIDCNFYQPDVGDMTWRSPAKPINEVDFIDCHLTKGPNITNGVKVIKFSNVQIGSSRVTKTV